MNDWISVDDRLPTSGARVLATWQCNVDSGIDVLHFWNGTWWWGDCPEEGGSPLPTHWMPLPSPPSAGQTPAH